jgi:NAD(P)-dependent dehydrogenase (short-subunit alcohol dehydrogenase family)
MFGGEVNDMKIENAVVVITGANRGLGRALAEATAKAGAKRVYVGARNPAQLDELVRSAPEKFVPLAIDVTDDRSVQAAAARAKDVTMLFNNAGTLASFNVFTSSPADIAKDFGTNATGLLSVTKAFLPALEANAKPGGAAIVNVLSIASLANVPGLGAYSASKAAAHSITQAMRSELAKKSIAVHGVFAGAIDTDMVRGMDMPKTSAADVARGILEGVEQGLEDIAPDPMSKDLFAKFRRDPKELEKILAAM